MKKLVEVRDGIHLLTPRAVNEEVGRALIREMKWYDHYLDLGEVDRSANTTPGNKKGGLANIVEKALGLCLSGSLGNRYEEVLECGISGVMSIISRPMNLADCMTCAPELIQRATERLCQVVKTGIEIGIKTTK